MMEGAQLPWKVQKIDISRGPPAEYSSLSLPLPKPPNGMKWYQDKDTREWHLVPEEKDSCSDKTEFAAGAESAVVVADEENKITHLEHTVLPSDTLPGICLRYKVTATQLRQANRFSGSNLLLAPAKLIIPLSANVVVKKQDVTSPEYKMHALMSAMPKLNRSEAQAYLKMAEWDLERAVQDAKEDLEWEASQLHADSVVVHEAVPVMDLLVHESLTRSSSVFQEESALEMTLQLRPLLTPNDMVK